MRASVEQLDYSKVIRVPKGGLVHASDESVIRYAEGNDNRFLRVFISSAHIERRIKCLADEIAVDAEETRAPDLHLVIVLKGAEVFANRLISLFRARRQFQVTFSCLAASSYADQMRSSGKILIKGDFPPATGKSLLIVEDIVDTGLTLSALKDFLLCDKQAASVRVCALMDKPSRRLPALRRKSRPDYTGFEIPDLFVAGYGLDYGEKFRELPCVVVVS